MRNDVDLKIAKELFYNELISLVKQGMNYFQAFDFLKNKYSEELSSGFKTEPNSILENPCLIEILLDEIGKKVVNERDTVRVIFLCSVGRLVENAKKTSFNLIVNDESGAGKDWVVEKTLELWKNCKKRYTLLKKKKTKEGEIEEQIPMITPVMIKRTRISEKVFTYWHNPKFEPDWSWDDVIFYNEDISSNVLNSDVFKVMASTGSHATVIINQMPVDIEIRGKPVMIVTTATSTPNIENMRRFSIVSLDTSENQTKNIMERQAELNSLGVSIDYDENILNELTRLKPKKVIIPFAKEISKFIPSSSLMMRTFFERFLDYIKASAVLHQYQRVEIDGWLIAESQDYEIAKQVLEKLTMTKNLVPMTKNQKRILEILKEMGEGYHPIIDIESKVTFMSRDKLRDNLDKLADKGLLNKGKIVNDKGRELIAYELPFDFENFRLPSFNDIKNDYYEKVENASLTLINANLCNPINPNLKGDTSNEVNRVNEVNLVEGVNNNNEVNEVNNFIDSLNSSNNEEKLEKLKNKFNNRIPKWVIRHLFKLGEITNYLEIGKIVEYTEFYSVI